MHASLILAAVAAIPAMAVPTPVQSVNLTNSVDVAKKSFTVNQVEVKKVKKNGPSAYKKALAKYNIKQPYGMTAAIATASRGNVTANPQQYDSQYLSPVQIGKNGQTFQLDFDTGSADLWVFSNEMSKSDIGQHTAYNPSSSKAKKLSGASWKISYGDGSGASGDVYTDKVTVGGVTATSQAVEAASSASAQFVQDAPDGLLGLAFSSINTVQPTQQKTWFDTVSESLDAPLFAVSLKKGAPGSYDFGYIDDSKYTGDLVYTDVDSSQGFWAFTAGDYSVGSGSSGSYQSKRSSKPSTSSGSIGKAIADTGTSLALIPDAACKVYYNAAGGQMDSQQQGYVAPCTGLPDFSFEVEGQTLTIPGEDIPYAPLNDGSGNCYGGLQSSQGQGFSILGDIFLKSQYVVFDLGNTRLGFAPQA